MKTKIIMDNGREYITELSIHQVKGCCVNEIRMPMGGTATTFINGFIDLPPNIVLNPSHISSLEELND